ncbi:hypothetical protein GOP47_0025088 [Adiantum capillus-veneris]|uniref:Nudix hydrolase domain-containing protein n=1 Tax=Adiantum capillus-veneris TaxID=13818 RepID=A0A9D4Z365_ADICA|nr:hypothetical protein GOP47_0025088 [Adiantum capillus-veneris]
MAGILSRSASGGGPPPRMHKPSHMPSQELLDDLCSRFVLNAPDEELQSFERILFLIEQAHWFYEDNSREQHPSLKSLTAREFTALMFQSCAALRPYIANIDDIYKDFTSYKVRVPVTGAIILDESYEKCLLVKGWKAGASWSFPRGKKNKDEEDHKCAIREVWEETGFDVSELLKVEDDLEVVIGEQRIRLFIVGGVSESTLFAPRTKNEISDIFWHRIDGLPMGGNEPSYSRGANGMKYYMVTPFVGPLKAWIARHKPLSGQKLEPSSKDSTPLLPLPVSEPQVGELVDGSRKGFQNFKFNYALILQKLDEQ